MLYTLILKRSFFNNMILILIPDITIMSVKLTSPSYIIPYSSAEKMVFLIKTFCIYEFLFFTNVPNVNITSYEQN